MCSIITMPLFTTTPINTGMPMKAMMLNSVPVSQNSQNTPNTENSTPDMIAGEQQRLEHGGHHHVDHHQRDQQVEVHLLHRVLVVLEAAAVEAVAVAVREGHALERRFHRLLRLGHGRLGREVGLDGERGLAVAALDLRAAGLTCTSTIASSGTLRPSGERTVKPDRSSTR